MTLKAIQTTYKGYKFRSRLEARWAVFFDALGLAWEYEPEGYELPSGSFYLPDFRVIIQDRVYWFEIKSGDESENDKFNEFMTAAPEECRGAVLNDIPDPTYVRESQGHYYYRNFEDRLYQLWGGSNGGWDNFYKFCICQTCKKVGFEFDGRSARISCSCPKTSRDHTANHPLIVAAFAKARAARFEHDEREIY